MAVFVKDSSDENQQQSPAPEAAKPNRRAPVIIKSQPKKNEPIDTAKAVAFAQSIAMEMKRSARQTTEKPSENEIRLSKRPTTREKGQNTIKFPDADLAEFRKRLIAERDKAYNGVDAMALEPVVQEILATRG